ncbi:MAG: peptidylprolyl isomerase [Thermoproteota archaeon]|nr:peptidylprolyl isomerase [Thermoproteota archaeon]
MTLEKGSLILIDYTAKTKDTNEVFETTVEEDAKNLESYDSATRYEPRLVSIGDGWVIKGLDEALSNANAGDKIDVEIPPEKGFGIRDPSKIRMIAQRKLGEKADELRPGDIVDVDDRKGIIRFVGSGRVQIDYNHRLAGRTLNYSVNLLKILTADEEKIKSLIRRRLPIDTEKLKADVNNQSLSITIPEESTLIEGIQIIKKAIANDLFKYLPTLENIRFVEEYIRNEKETIEEKKDRPKDEKETIEEKKDRPKDV